MLNDILTVLQIGLPLPGFIEADISHDLHLCSRWEPDLPRIRGYIADKETDFSAGGGLSKAWDIADAVVRERAIYA